MTQNRQADGLIIFLKLPYVKKVVYAARDNYAGFTELNLNNNSNFIKNKNLEIVVPNIELELIQIVLKTDYLLRVLGKSAEGQLKNWSKFCPRGVKLGSKWYEENKLVEASKSKKSISEIIDDIQRELAHI